ncbi:MAG TPA: hypothetical protein VLD40_05255 [Dissulfurispiraceae bacterium]|nr:hypothetical protein [Dissulfurispiraceae bacterium]
MGKVKSAFEKAMERAAEMGELTTEEKEELREREKVKSLLAEFYKGHLKRDDLWQQLKGVKPALLKEAQMGIVDSMRLGTPAEEFSQKRDGVLALETLKDKSRTAAVENVLKTLDAMRKEYDDRREAAIKELRTAIEKNPQLRVRPVKTPDGRTVLQAAVSVDEAVQARMAEFLAEHEKRYEEIFGRVVEKLKGELR